MSWLAPVRNAETPFEAVLGLRPELLELYRRFYGALWDEQLVPAGILELCRLRIAMLHGCEAELAIRHEGAGVPDEKVAELERWEGSGLFTPSERAALRFAEKMPWQHHEITDEEFAAIRDQLREPGAVAFTVAVALFDANCRLRLALSVAPAPATFAVPASAGGRLY